MNVSDQTIYNQIDEKNIWSRRLTSSPTSPDPGTRAARLACLGVTCLGRGNSGQVVFTHESPFALSFNDTREFESGNAHGDRFREGA